MEGHDKIRSCTLEVDLEYPRKLHDLHNDYPLAPQTVTVNDKIHRGIGYEGRKFLKRYIASNTESRKAATKEFGKDFYKLMNNSVFGKTMENVRARSKIRIVNGHETKTLARLIAKPHYRGSYIFEDSGLVSLRMGESTVTLNKPNYLGQTILDLSKALMYDFHYGYVKPKYGNRARLLFTNIDSLCYRIQTEDFYEDISKDVPKWFDTSNYPKDHHRWYGQEGFGNDERRDWRRADNRVCRSKVQVVRKQDGGR